MLLIRTCRLSFYCNDSTIDAIPLAFLYIFFDENGSPVIDFANVIAFYFIDMIILSDVCLCIDLQSMGRCNLSRDKSRRLFIPCPRYPDMSV